MRPASQKQRGLVPEIKDYSLPELSALLRRGYPRGPREASSWLLPSCCPNQAQ